ncbi:MAG: DUF6273 domain-containing protein [Coriobacteriales bacterium]|jgi:hypothetical protein|nr:DUF6273 domain-containing protein [Coriobacteriales bacterium]
MHSSKDPKRKRIKIGSFSQSTVNQGLDFEPQLAAEPEFEPELRPEFESEFEAASELSLSSLSPEQDAAKSRKRSIQATIITLAFVLALTAFALVLATPKFTPTPGPQAGELVQYGTVSFTDYQGGTFSENITWKVLANEGGRVLVVSEKVIDLRPYHEESKAITWEQSDVRTWLNGAFYEGLPSELKGLVVGTKLTNARNPVHETPGGTNTKDKVFLLSIDEVQKYFVKDEERVAATSLSAATVAHFGEQFGLKPEDAQKALKNQSWWLRSPGDAEDTASGVQENGKVFPPGVYVESSGGVRPAMWLDYHEHSK